MQYVDMSYYFSNYRGNTIDAANLDRQLRKASMEVNSLCFNRIGSNLDNLSDYEKEIIKEVVCEVADFNYTNKETLESVNGSYSIGDVSVQNLDSKTITQENGYFVPFSVISMLDSTRLRNKLL